MHACCDSCLGCVLGVWGLRSTCSLQVAQIDVHSTRVTRVRCVDCTEQSLHCTTEYAHCAEFYMKRAGFYMPYMPCGTVQLHNKCTNCRDLDLCKCTILHEHCKKCVILGDMGGYMANRFQNESIRTPASAMLASRSASCVSSWQHRTLVCSRMKTQCPDCWIL